MDIQGSNHGTLQNGATFAPGLVGQTFSFDGVDDYFDYGVQASLNFAAAAGFTIDGWVKTTDTFGPIVAQRHSSNGAPIIEVMVGFDGIQTSPGRLMAIVRDDEAGEFGANRVTGGPVNDGNWHFFTLVRTGGTIELFLDGVSQGTSSSAASDGAITTNLRTLGAERRWVQVGFGSGDQRFLSGAVDEVEIYNRALTAGEVQAIYTAGSAGKCRGLSISTAAGPTLRLGQPSSFRFEAVLGQPPYTWSLASGTLPPGMALGSDGSVSGTPAQAGEFPFSIRVRDSFGATATRTFTFVVVAMASPTGLVSRWLADGNANDTENLNNGVLQNGATFAPGKVGSAFSFAGRDDVVLVPHSSSLNVASSHTIAAWAFRTSPAVPQHLVGKRVGCGFDTTFIQLAIGTNAIPSPAVPLNTWSHLAVTYDGRLALYYVNGVVASNWVVTLGNNTAPLLIGNSGTCAPFAGLIDDVQIYNRALSQLEIQSIMQPGLSIATSIVPTLQIGQPSSFQFDAAFGQPPYTWSLDSGALAPGMALRSDGLVSGTPAQVGQFTFSVRVQDRLGATSTRAFTQQVVAAPAPVRALLAEDFEDGVLDARMSVRTTGTFSVGPGIKNVTNFGSTKAFGFGLSTCGASCFSGFVNTLQIAFPAPEFIVSISFKEMELFGNWGSGGGIFIDGQPLTANSDPQPGFSTYRDFGRLPYDDRQADTTFRSRLFPVNRAVTTIELRVGNISNSSELYIDDLVVQELPAGPPEFTADSIVSAAGLQPGLPLTPGQIVTIFGTEFADPCTLAGSGSGACALAQGFPLPIQLGSTQVTFNGIAAPLLVVTEHQINLIVPWELSGDTAVVVVRRGQTSSLGVRVGLSRQAIGLFSILSSGAGAGVVLHADGRAVSRSAPIVPGEVVVLYGTGMGAVAPAVATRSPAPVEPLSWTTIPMRVFFDGTEGRILFSGLTPGFSGLCQMNVEVPAFLARNYAIVRVQNDTYISNDVSAGGPSLLDVTPNQVRLGLNSSVAVRGLNFPPNARLRVFGTDLAGVRDVAGGLERFTVSVPASLLRPGRVPISLVDASQPSEAPSNAVSLLVVP